MEQYEAVRREVFRQLLEHGVEGTTYASIAQTCGVTRSLVQLYFPSKDSMSAELFDTIARSATQGLEPYASEHQTGDGTIDINVKMLLGAIATYQMLQSDDGCRRFGIEYLRDRALTRVGHRVVIEWYMGLIGMRERLDDQNVADAISYSLGGFVEVFYAHVSAGVPLDVRRHYLRVMREWGSAMGYSETILDAIMKNPAVAECDVDDLALRGLSVLKDFLQG